MPLQTRKRRVSPNENAKHYVISGKDPDFIEKIYIDEVIGKKTVVVVVVFLFFFIFGSNWQRVECSELSKCNVMETSNTDPFMCVPRDKFDDNSRLQPAIQILFLFFIGYTHYGIIQVFYQSQNTVYV